MTDEPKQESAEQTICCEDEYSPVKIDFYSPIEDIQIKMEVNDATHEHCEVDSGLKCDVDVKAEVLDFASDHSEYANCKNDDAEANGIISAVEVNLHENGDSMSGNQSTVIETKSIDKSLTAEPDQNQFEDNQPTHFVSPDHELKQLTVSLNDVLNTPEYSKSTSISPNPYKVGNNWKCPKCDLSFRSLGAVKLHLKRNKNCKTSVGSKSANHKNQIKRGSTKGIKMSIGKNKVKTASRKVRANKSATLNEGVSNMKNMFGRYKCPECSYTNTLRSCISRHLSCHRSGVKIYTCESCDFKSTNIILAKHQILCHPKVYDVLRCMECSYTGKSVSSLDQHIKVHHLAYYKKRNKSQEVNLKDSSLMKEEGKVSETRIKVNHDRSTFESEKSILTQKMCSNRPSKCLNCNFVGTKMAVNNHWKKCHEEGSPLIQPNMVIPATSCGTCQYETQSLTDLQQHSKLHSLRCELCSYLTDSAKLFLTHKQFHLQHRNDNKHASLKNTKGKQLLFKCQDCDFQTEKRSLLQNHKNIHINTQKVKIYKYNILVNGQNVTVNMYSCSKCSYQTKSFNALVRHQMAHGTKEKIFRCQWCEFKTGYKQFLTRHIGKVHMNKTSKLCQVKDVAFGNKSSENSHLKSEALKYRKFNSVSQNSKSHNSKISLSNSFRHSGKNVILVSSESDSDTSTSQSDQKIKKRLLAKRESKSDISDYSQGAKENSVTPKKFRNKYQDTFNPDSKCSLAESTLQNVESDLENLLDLALIPKHQSDSSSSDLDSLLDCNKTQPAFKCPTCTFATGKREKYLKHLSSHGDIKKLYVCENCDFISIEKHRLAAHLFSHVKSYKIYLCECGFSNKVRDKLNSHRDTDCVMRLKVCDCGFESRNDVKMEKHKSRDCPERMRPPTTVALDSEVNTSQTKQICEVDLDMVTGMFKCPSCFYQAKYKRAVKSHYLRCHVGEAAND